MAACLLYLDVAPQLSLQLVEVMMEVVEEEVIEVVEEVAELILYTGFEPLVIKAIVGMITELISVAWQYLELPPNTERLWVEGRCVLRDLL